MYQCIPHKFHFPTPKSLHFTIDFPSLPPSSKKKFARNNPTKIPGKTIKNQKHQILSPIFFGNTRFFFGNPDLLTHLLADRGSSSTRYVVGIERQGDAGVELPCQNSAHDNNVFFKGLTWMSQEMDVNGL